MKECKVYFDIYKDLHQWKKIEARNFVIKLPNISKFIQKIENKISVFESSFNEISALLNIKTKLKLTLYLLPNTELYNSQIIFANTAIPHLQIAAIIYKNSTSNESLIKTYRHELTHLLAYHWDYQIYHIELLEEGLACYFSNPEMNYHQKYLDKLNRYFKNGIFVNQSLLISKKYRSVDYDKAASFVQFLIENYGMDKFKELYVASVVDRDNVNFIINNDIIPNTYLYTLIKKIFDKEPIEIQLEWYDNLGLVL